MGWKGRRFGIRTIGVEGIENFSPSQHLESVFLNHSRLQGLYRICQQYGIDFCKWRLSPKPSVGPLFKYLHRRLIIIASLHQTSIVQEPPPLSGISISQWPPPTETARSPPNLANRKPCELKFLFVIIAPVHRVDRCRQPSISKIRGRVSWSITCSFWLMGNDVHQPMWASHNIGCRWTS